MTTREQLTHERVLALTEQLAELQNLNEFRSIGQTTELGEARAVTSSRQKAVSQIVSDYQAARSNFDTAVSDYQNAGTVAEEFAAVVSAVQAQQSQIDEIVEYLVLTREDI